MTWDKSNLEGRVVAGDIAETAQKYVPEMLEAGADLIVAIPHSGFEAGERQGMDENAVSYLSEVEGRESTPSCSGTCTACLRPNKFEGFPGADLEAGTINGVPSVRPRCWGSYLGVIDLTLE